MERRAIDKQLNSIKLFLHWIVFYLQTGGWA